MAHIVLISPRFATTLWGGEYGMRLLGKRATMPQACLPLLAALTPEEHTVELVDETVEPLDFDRVAEADIVGVTAMVYQGARAREILGEFKKRGICTVAGGALVTAEENYFADVADAIFIGEAESTWPQFLRDWSQGRHQYRYEQADKTDMTTVPTPRFDLLKLEHYMSASVQISRGCPFQCEFCDIIITFGRRPRLKTSAQVIEELDVLVERGVRIVFVVDDNLIGNKKAIKPVLEDIAAWQRRRGYPLALFTEATLDLAEEDSLMALMGEAGFQTVFIGIESPNEASLVETKKFQNVRPRHGTMLERVSRIQQRGIEVFCGMIVGFDNDDVSAFDAVSGFIQDAKIINALVGTLFAFAKTPLYDRLRREGRIDERDVLEFQSNIVPLRMSRRDLRDGVARVISDIYSVDAYFGRMDTLFIGDQFRYKVDQISYWRRHPLRRAKRISRYYLGYLVLRHRLLRTIPEEELRREYLRRLRNFVRKRPFDPHLLFIYVIKIAMHYHYHQLVLGLSKAREAQGESRVAA
jgi:radical SAM superfamily enzyme YgiQ (UPF0313 family)